MPIAYSTAVQNTRSSPFFRTEIESFLISAFLVRHIRFEPTRMVYENVTAVYILHFAVQ